MRACFGELKAVENGGGQLRNRLGFRAAGYSRRELAVCGMGWRRMGNRIMTAGYRMALQGIAGRGQEYGHVKLHRRVWRCDRATL